MPTETDSWDAMMSAVRAFHDKHELRERGGEELTYRVALMAEELGEISAYITRGKARKALAEELADLLILIVGTDIAANLDLKSAFWVKMNELMQRQSQMVDGCISECPHSATSIEKRAIAT